MPSGRMLIVTEGKDPDIDLMKKLLDTYGIAQDRDIIPYGTNIHNLCRSLLREKDIADVDLRLHLREYEKDPAKKALLSQRFSEILLIFDLDPQDAALKPEVLLSMTNHFTESTDAGKLYLNYPMIEAFYHMTSIPDPDYNARTATLSELKAKQYKPRVDREGRNGRNNEDFAATKEECDCVIRQNISKAWLLAEAYETKAGKNDRPPPQNAILSRQLDMLSRAKAVSVLCTCAFYISDYNPALIRPNASGVRCASVSV